MGMIKRSLLLALLLQLCMGTALWAQETRTVDGRSYIVHRVEAGQTLFAISRSYAVPVDALVQANPGSEAGLSIGQELLVPRDAVVRKEARTAPIMLRDGELQHTVAKRETLFGIARSYGVDINALLERNPELNAGLREGMIVVVPMGEVTGQPESVVRPAVAEELVEHVVQPGETLFGLGQRYGVGPERIRAANGGLPEGLKAGEVVRIPVEAGSTPVVAEPMAPVRTDARYTLGLMLPFALDRNDSVLSASQQGRDARFYEATRIAAQFNAGAMLALDSLKSLGLDAEVFVVDMGEDPRTWNGVLKRPEIKNVDLFIGPFHRSAIDQLAKVAPSAHIVCPVPQSNKVILGNPKVSKVTATRVDLIRHSARYVVQRHGRDNIIMLKPDIHADREAVDQMQRALNAALAGQAGRSGDSVLVIPTGRRDVGKLVSHFKSGLNVVVVPSEDLEYVTNVVAILRPMASKQQIAVVGMESWSAMETVSATDLETLGFMFASASFVDYEDPDTQAFIKAFRERFKNDVDEYAFLGFDVTFYYGRMLMTYGRGFPERFASLGQRTLHMDFRMSRTGPENGYKNEAAVMLKQQGLKLVKLQ